MGALSQQLPLRLMRETLHTAIALDALKTGRVEYLIVEASSLFGGSAKYQPVPWSFVQSGVTTGQFMVPLTKEQFKAAPSYDREQLAGVAYGWNEQSTSYFAALDQGV